MKLFYESKKKNDYKEAKKLLLKLENSSIKNQMQLDETTINIKIHELEQYSIWLYTLLMGYLQLAKTNNILNKKEIKILERYFEKILTRSDLKRII